MNRLNARLIAAIALALFGGTATAQSIPLEQAMQRLESTLATIPHLKESDLLSDEAGQRFQTAKRFVRDRQCSSGTANPLLAVAVPTHVNLRGKLEGNGGPRVSDDFALPLRVAPLADLPSQYLKDMTALAESKGLPVEIALDLKKEMRAAYYKLSATVSSLLNSFHTSSCPRLPRQTGMLNTERWILFVPPTY